MSNRYLPQIRLQEIGKSGQERLGTSRVLIIGCGALGSPIAMYLAGAGIGNLTVADFDNVELSNLHRQVFYYESETGKPKAELLSSKINALNSEIEIEFINKIVTRRLLEQLTIKPDIIVDAADNPATTYLLDNFCYENAIPLVIGGVSGWNAQVFTYIPGSYRYSDIFSAPSGNTGVLPCSLTGIVGPSANFAASIQSAQVIKLLLDKAGKDSSLITANLLSGSFNLIS